MISKLKLTVILAIGAVSPICATDTLGIVERAFVAASPDRELFKGCFANPAMRPFEIPVSISSIRASFASLSESSPIEIQRGDGFHSWNLNANTYIRHKSSTFWGNAGYSNGLQKSVQWNETSDADIIYPYFTADSIGGDLNFERYSFAGGYAERIGRFAVGASLSYNAGLYYRDIDPRPKNITGRLDAAVGGSYSIDRIGNIGIALSYRRYKQTNDIDFVSEMGKTKIYHLTGLGNHYQRFAGNGEEASFDGHRFGLSVQLYPATTTGAVASASVSRFTFKKILTGLNRLPLCRAWHNRIKLETGYKGESTSVLASFEAYRRHGIENIFGDASSNIYPQIGELEMYADNSYTLALTAIREWPAASSCRIGLHPALAFSHRSTIYAEPASEQLLERINGYLELSFRAVARRWFFNAGASWGIIAPTRSRLLLPESNKLTEIVSHDFRFASSTVNTATVRAEVSRSVNKDIALGIYGSCNSSFYTASVHSTSFNLGINIYF